MEAQTSHLKSAFVIKASPAWRTVDLAELWRYRELLSFFVWRGVKVRYKQTTLGIAWAVIQPLFAMLMFVAIFGRVARLPSDGAPYSLFAYSGLLPWMFFSNAFNAGAASLFGSTQLVTKVYFPRILIPVSAVSTALVDFLLASVMLVPLLLLERVAPSTEAVIGIPMAFAVWLLLTFALAFWGSALVGRYCGW